MPGEKGAEPREIPSKALKPQLLLSSGCGTLCILPQAGEQGPQGDHILQPSQDWVVLEISWVREAKDDLSVHAVWRRAFAVTIRDGTQDQKQGELRLCWERLLQMPFVVEG